MSACRNEDSAECATVIVTEADGSFSLELEADVTDKVVLTIEDTSGNKTTFSPGPFRDPDTGATIIGSEGGTVEDIGGEGFMAIVPPGALPDGTPVRVEPITSYDIGATGANPDAFRFCGGIFLDMPEGLRAEKEIHLSVPIPEGISLVADEELLVFRETDVFGTPRIMLINVATADLGEGCVRTASPPFVGAVSEGPSMFFKQMYPGIGKMSVLTPSPMLAGSILGISCAEFGDIFADMLYYMTAPICLIPTSGSFTVTAWDPENSSEPLSVLSDPPMIDDQVLVPYTKDDDGSSSVIQSSYPGENGTDVPTDAHVLIRLTSPIFFDDASLSYLAQDGKTTSQVAGELRYGSYDSENPENPSDGGTISLLAESDGNSVNGGNTFVFVPGRRLRYGTTYTVSITGYEDAQPLEAVAITLTFTTMHVRVTGSAKVEFPSDIAVLGNGCGVAVANGSMYASAIGAKEFVNDQNGVVVIDYSDIANLSVKAKRPISGATLGVCAGYRIPADAQGNPLPKRDGILAVSGGLDRIGMLRFFRADGELTSEGTAFLSMDSASLHNGFVMTNTPPYEGIPTEVAFADPSQTGADDEVAYVATMGIGVQGISLSDAAATQGGITNAEEPSLYDYGTLVDVPTPVAVATLKGMVLAGDMDSIRFLNGDLTEAQDPDFYPRIPARDIATVADYPVVGTNDEGSEPTEDIDLVLAAGHGDDGNLYIAEITSEPPTLCLLSRVPLWDSPDPQPDYFSGILGTNSGDKILGTPYSIQTYDTTFFCLKN